MSTFLKTTSNYRSIVKALAKKSPSIEEDIKNAFKDSSFEEIFEHNYRLKDLGVLRVIKYRVANSAANKGKSAGHRVLLVACRNTKTVTLLNALTKSGPDGRDNFDKAEVKECFNDYKQEIKQAQLEQLIEADGTKAASADNPGFAI